MRRLLVTQLMILAFAIGACGGRTTNTQETADALADSSSPEDTRAEVAADAGVCNGLLPPAEECSSTCGDRLSGIARYDPSRGCLEIGWTLCARAPGCQNKVVRCLVRLSNGEIFTFPGQCVLPGFRDCTPDEAVVDVELCP